MAALDTTAASGDVVSRALPITVRGVTKTFGSVTALEAMDLDIRAGEFLTLLGPSGSGKTTLLMVLAGFERPDRGSIRFGEAEMIRTPPHRRGVGMVFQSYALFPHMTVAGNVGYPLRLRGVARADMAERVERALSTVQLGGYGDRRIDQLSGGQRQRVALARAIVFEPQILLMDEPLSALDKKLRDQMQIEIRRLHERLGMTTVYVTHDQREALTMSDRIAVINYGRLMQLDDPVSLYEHPQNRFVADFIGESAFLPVERTGDTVAYRGQPLLFDGAMPSGADPVLMLRPERLSLVAPGETEARVNRFPARVVDVVYQGDSYLMVLDLDGAAEVTLRGITRRGTLATLPQAGAEVTIGLGVEDTVVLADG